MGKEKRKSWEWSARAAQTGLVTLAGYVVGILLLALLMTKGTLAESLMFPAVGVWCCAAALIGGILAARKSTLGVLPAALLNGGIFAVGLILIGLACWHEILWTGEGGRLLLCVLGGTLLAGFLGRGGKKRKKRK